MNGFSGGRLPSRDQIRSIRIRQNNYAADNHDAGRSQIEIVTRPNTQLGRQREHQLRWRHASTRASRSSWSRRRRRSATCSSACAGRSLPGRRRSTSTSTATTRYNSNPIIAIDEFGNADQRRGAVDERSEGLPVRHSSTRSTHNQSLLFNLQRTDQRGPEPGRRRLQPARARLERASTTRRRSRFRLQGIVGSTKLNEFRVAGEPRTATRRPRSSSAPTIIVQDAFTSGGAGVNSNSSTNRVELADNFDFNVGTKHQMRVGVLLESSFYSNFDERNAAGTWTYRTIEDFNANRPRSSRSASARSTRRLSSTRRGVYWSDEFRLHRDVTLGIGVRNEMQSRIDDKLNLMPRVGFTWAPFGSQRVGDPRRLRALLRLVRLRASTTRRCAWTASPSATSASPARS